MKTRVNGIPQIQALCPWHRFGRSSEKRKSGATFCMLIIFSSLIVSLKDVLSPMHVNRKWVFCILEQYSAEQYDAQIFGQSVLLRLLVIEIWVSWHIKKDKGLSSYWRASNVLCLSSLLKEEAKAQCWAKIKKKENVWSAPCRNARMATVRKDGRNFALAVRQCWSRDINLKNVYSR